jgi:hypothetical protein
MQKHNFSRSADMENKASLKAILICGYLKLASSNTPHYCTFFGVTLITKVLL